MGADMSELERWETRFSAPEYVFGTAPNAFLAKQKTRLPKSGRALSVADGEGRNGVWLAEQGLDVLSIDFSAKAQAKARALAQSRNVKITTELADVTLWRWPVAEFDVVAVIFTQFLVPAVRGEFFARIRNALKPGGLLLMQGYTPRQLQYGTGGPKQIEQLYTRALLEAEFAGMSAVEVNEYDCEMREGGGHNGMSAVIDLVARK
jgi:cyclopropane fatty-acyl-phospholipid synthase-like methyltransferase